MSVTPSTILRNWSNGSFYMEKSLDCSLQVSVSLQIRHFPYPLTLLLLHKDWNWVECWYWAHYRFCISNRSFKNYKKLLIFVMFGNMTTQTTWVVEFERTKFTKICLIYSFLVFPLFYEIFYVYFWDIFFGKFGKFQRRDW